jgi:hypothetical protein
MHCKQARQQIASLPHPSQSPSDLTRHTAQCLPCAGLLEERTTLHNALARLRAETAALGPSTHVDQQVLAALNAAAAKLRSASHTFRWITVRALAFAAILAAAVLFSVSRAHKAAPIAELPHEEPFTPMPYVDSAAPHEHTTIIRTKVSAQIMQDAGLTVQDDPDSTALADVVLGEDGRLLALRLISHPHPASPKRID